MPIAVIAQSGVRWRRRSSFHLEEEVIGVAPPPILARLVGADDGMAGVGLPMPGSVTARGVVAAADVPAAHAHAQVHPASTKTTSCPDAVILLLANSCGVKGSW